MGISPEAEPDPKIDRDFLKKEEMKLPHFTNQIIQKNKTLFVGSTLYHIIIDQIFQLWFTEDEIQ